MVSLLQITTLVCLKFVMSRHAFFVSESLNETERDDMFQDKSPPFVIDLPKRLAMPFHTFVSPVPTLAPHDFALQCSEPVQTNSITGLFCFEEPQNYRAGCGVAKAQKV